MSLILMKLCVVIETECKKAKVQYLLERFLHESDSRPEALLQSRKWQLIGMS